MAIRTNPMQIWPKHWPPGDKRGLILLTCGTYGNVVRILVPLTASDAIVDEGLAIIEASMAALQIA